MAAAAAGRFGGKIGSAAHYSAPTVSHPPCKRSIIIITCAALFPALSNTETRSCDILKWDLLGASCLGLLHEHQNKYPRDASTRWLSSCSCQRRFLTFCCCFSCAACRCQSVNRRRNRATTAAFPLFGFQTGLVPANRYTFRKPRSTQSCSSSMTYCIVGR